MRSDHPGPGAPIAASRVVVNDIELHVREAGAGPLVVLCHGFPQTSSAWTSQIRALADAGFRVLAPDMRGYGASSRPTDLDAYNVEVISGDLLGLLDLADEQEAIFVGHDLGATMIWHLARAHPTRVRALVALSVPFSPPPPIPPTQALRRLLGEDHYLLFFQEPDAPEQALLRDVRRTLLTEGGWTRAWAAGAEVPERPAWLSEHDLLSTIETFTRTGFAGGLAYYRNLDRNWELSQRLAARPVRKPALFISGANDIVRTFAPVEPMRAWVEDLRVATIPEAGHFVHQQHPEQVDQLLVDFCRKAARSRR
ncbi:MAG: alpha/beta hydrolase [Actinomycetota bacterium]|nr:alpha/beta hydrolase [Actinomycetota bacterium]